MFIAARIRTSCSVNPRVVIFHITASQRDSKRRISRQCNFCAKRSASIRTEQNEPIRGKLPDGALSKVESVMCSSTLEVPPAKNGCYQWSPHSLARRHPLASQGRDQSPAAIRAILTLELWPSYKSFFADSGSNATIVTGCQTFDTFNPPTQNPQAHLSRRPCVSSKLRSTALTPFWHLGCVRVNRWR
jgi:hypothetical protein